MNISEVTHIQYNLRRAVAFLFFFSTLLRLGVCITPQDSNSEVVYAFNLH